MFTIPEIFTNSCKTLFWLPLGIAVINLGFDSQSAQALTFQETTKGKLEFRDYDHQLVATGSFNYSPTPFEGFFAVGEILDLYSDYDEDGNYYEYYLPTGYYEGIFYNDPSQIPNNLYIVNTLEIEASQNLHLTDIQINLSGSQKKYYLSSYLPNQSYFFNPLSSSISQVKISADKLGNVFLFSTDAWYYQSDLIGEILISIDAAGFFSFFDYDENVSLDGTWTASAVPEPLTLFGVSTALSFGAFFKRKLLKKSKTV
ncbi:PEP-CTERM sorting domain-containing protein [Gloeothece verrucosa]|uniref:PEP-CTERM protein-sorting domain-containing protein n=1 Tax=Gloeothece verrucosa (strain PCC 7822) TaxID=497965 RepID=E0UAV8_GLOV7|nr:PEP-CTERM sorting domain-containing protein [Gloeothece verrucosa]ADN15080.1 hypothetical protein Cyan7822_3126 [Gloeothece verrucosa PCC 7822]